MNKKVDIKIQKNTKTPDKKARKPVAGEELETDDIDKPDDEFQDIVKGSKLQEDLTRKRKKLIKLGSIAAGILFFGYVVYLLFVPYKGGMNFGVCRVFLERYITYPPTLKLNSFEEFSDSIRIWHMHVDAFGQDRMEPIQCWFRTDEQTGLLVLDKVTIKRREIPQDYVEEFNKSIPTIYAHPPDLTLPYPLSDKLENLYFEENSFVKPIL